MTKNNVSFQDLYKIIDEFRKEQGQSMFSWKEEVNERFDKIEIMFKDFHKEEFSPLQKSVDKLMTYGTLAIGILSFVGTAVWEWLRSRFLRG